MRRAEVLVLALAGLASGVTAQVAPAPAAVPAPVNVPLPAARWTAERIAGAELLVLESGGHLLSGRSEEVRAAIGAFLRRRLT